jgi:hypothetical protein
MVMRSSSPTEVTLCLQLNFRGSSSKGVSRNSAHLQWGGKVINDLIDGVKWTVQQGEVDGSRMCVVRCFQLRRLFGADAGVARAGPVQVRGRLCGFMTWR